MAEVKCPICGVKFNYKKLNENVDYKKIVTEGGSIRYCHYPLCSSRYEEQLKEKEAKKDRDAWINLWRKKTSDYLYIDLKIPIDFIKFGSQWKNCIKRGYNPEDIYNCIKYLYMVQNANKEKCGNGIGLILTDETIMEQSKAYWFNQKLEHEQFHQQKQAIDKQLSEQEIKYIPKVRTKKEKIVNWEIV